MNELFVTQILVNICVKITTARQFKLHLNGIFAETEHCALGLYSKLLFAP